MQFVIFRWFYFRFQITNYVNTELFRMIIDSQYMIQISIVLMAYWNYA